MPPSRACDAKDSELGAISSGVFRWVGLRKANYLPRPSAASGWPPALLDGQHVELVHGVADGKVCFEVRYAASGEDEGSAQASAHGLARDLGFGLAAAFGSYLFAHDAVRLPEQQVQWAHTYEFLPESCRISLGRPIGIGPAARAFGFVRMAAERNRRSSDFIRELIPLARTGGDNLEIVVRLGPRSLADMELHALSLALNSLYSPDRVTSDGGPVLPIQSAALSAALASVLELWLERRHGHEVKLSVRGPTPVSQALLGSLAGSVFHGMSGRWIERSADRAGPKGAEPEVLDLSCCRPFGAPAPAIAPPPDYFEAAGFSEMVTPVPGALPDAGILLGRTVHGEREERVRFAVRDRSRHCYVIGATGTGKSTLISNMVLQDIREGAGACVLDPHGDLYSELVRSVPGHRASDVIPIDIADPERAIGLNLLESRGRFARQQVSFAINEILSMFWMLYASVPEAMGPAFEQYMRNTLMVLAQNARGPGTVADVMPFYEDPAFRRRVLETCTSPAAASVFHADRPQDEW